MPAPGLVRCYGRQQYRKVHRERSFIDSDDEREDVKPTISVVTIKTKDSDHDGDSNAYVSTHRKIIPSISNKPRKPGKNQRILESSEDSASEDETDIAVQSEVALALEDANVNPPQVDSSSVSWSSEGEEDSSSRYQRHGHPLITNLRTSTPNLYNSTPLPLNARSMAFALGDINASPIVHRSTVYPVLPFSEDAAVETDNEQNLQKRHRRRSQRKLSYSVHDTMVDDGTRELQCILELCSEHSVRSFDDIFYSGQYCKIGEATFSEVYSDMPHLKTAMKVMPFGNSTVTVNGEPQRTHMQVLQELKANRRLSTFPHFIRLVEAHVVRGQLSDNLLQAWDDYGHTHVSENDRPDYLGDEQLFIILVLENGGVDLEKFRLRNGGQVRSLFAQVCAALAHAEQTTEFEHRDLHWGNILVDCDTDTSETIKLTAGGISFDLPSCGITARIIDFTLSRLRDEHDEILFVELQDLFDGDASVDFQFEVYRRMREHTQSEWSRYFPKTNAQWLEYLIEKLSGKCSRQWKLRDTLMQFKLETAGCNSALDVWKQFVENHGLC